MIQVFGLVLTFCLQRKVPGTSFIKGLWVHNSNLGPLMPLLTSQVINTFEYFIERIQQEDGLFGIYLSCSGYIHDPLYFNFENNYGPLARSAKLRDAHAPGMPGTFFPPPRFSDPDRHHGTCVTHVPWCMPGSLTSGLLWSRWWGKLSRHSRRIRNPQFWVSGKRPLNAPVL